MVTIYIPETKLLKKWKALWVLIECLLKWAISVDDKIWKSNLDLVLENNFEVEETTFQKKKANQK
jgi:hypothetical protein